MLVVSGLIRRSARAPVSGNIFNVSKNYYRRLRRSILPATALIAAAQLTTVFLPARAADPARPAAQAVTASTAPSENTALPLSAFEIPHETFTLENGLTVILAPDRTLPRVAVNLWYHVGPANEPAGKSGFAHLFEHLMFEGSLHLPQSFDALVESAGATNVNGTTDWDRTNYFETLPSQHLELALWLESDRMGFMTEALSQERLDVQRGVVKNERRQSFENAPYGPSYLALYDALFPPGHPYHGVVIGSMADLDRATMQDVRAFHQAYYAPSNATLVIAGHFDADATKSMVRRYFGSLPTRPRPARVITPTPPLQRPVQLVIEGAVQLPRVSMAWLAPPAFSTDDAALDVATTLLADGKATPLYRTLVAQGQIAADVSAALDANQLASIVTIDATVSGKGTPEQVLAETDKVLAELVAKGPSDGELARAKRKIELSVASSLQLLNGPSGANGRAGLLQRLHHYLGDAGTLPSEIAKLRAVTATDVQRVLQQHLRKDARVVVITLPTAPKENQP